MASSPQETKSQTDTINNDTARSEDINDEIWYPDSGATNHVTNSLSNLNLGSTEYKGTQHLFMGNGNITKITHIGNASLMGKKKQFYLNNLLRVPLIRKNLLSVSQFARDNNVYFKFYPSYCLVKDILTKEILLQGRESKGLYTFSITKSSSIYSANKGKCCSISEIKQQNMYKNFDIWHYKLGHPNAKIVKFILENNNIAVDMCNAPYVCTYRQREKKS